MNQQIAYLSQLKQTMELYQFMVKMCWLKTLLDAQVDEHGRSTAASAGSTGVVKEKSASGAKKIEAEPCQEKSTCKSLPRQEKSKVSTIAASEVIKGRMYDFNNGRFLSVDPFIQGTDSQALNPYSYIQNNPLSGVDPTGYCSQEDHLDDCAKDLQAGETEELTDDDGNRIGTVSRGDNNEKIITVEGKGTVVVENGYEGDRQTVKSVNDGKISDLKSQISELDPIRDNEQFVNTAEKVEFLEKQTKHFEHCTDSAGGCSHQLSGNYADQYAGWAKNLGMLVASSPAGGAGAGGGYRSTGFQKSKLYIEDVVKRSGKVINSQGLTKTIQRWEKHVERQGGTFPMLTGNNASKKVTIDNFIRSVMNNPGTSKTRLSGGATQYRLPNNGQGFRVESDGSLKFLDPYVPL